MIFNSKKLTGLSIIIFMILSFHVFAQNQDVVKISVTDKSIKINQGEQVSVTLSIVVNPTWHINSNKPNDEFLIPSEITARGNGVKLIGVKYPKAHESKLSFSEELVSVYEATSNAKLTFKSSQDAPVGKQKVLITLDYQACNDVSCMPPNATTTEFELDVIKKEVEEKSQSEALPQSDTTGNEINSVKLTETCSPSLIFMDLSVTLILTTS